VVFQHQKKAENDMMLVLVAAVIPPHFQAHPHARQ
jgi:hypothetical protein